MTSTAALEFSICSMRFGAFTVSTLREISARAANRHPLFANIATLPLLIGGVGLVAAVLILPIMVEPLGADGAAEPVTFISTRALTMDFCCLRDAGRFLRSADIIDPSVN